MGVTTHTRNLVTISVDSGVDGTASICVFALVLALGLFEMQRRAAVGVSASTSWTSCLRLPSKQIVMKCVPETVLLIGCLGTVGIMLWRHQAFSYEEDSELWEQIKSEWPRLLCADTLLAIQAMLRLVVLLAAIFHRNDASPVCLASEAATLLGFGCLARTTVGALSAPYLLDGPLGGNLPVACDVMSIFVAFWLGRACFTKQLLPTVFMLLTMTWLASRHCLNLSGGHAHLDALFVASYGFDSLASLSIFLRSLSFGASLGAVPRQAILTAHAMIGTYYFHYGLPYTEDLVLAGRPMEFLQIAHTAAAASCLGAMVLFIFDETPPVELYPSRTGAIMMRLKAPLQGGDFKASDVVDLSAAPMSLQQQPLASSMIL